MPSLFVFVMLRMWCGVFLVFVVAHTAANDVISPSQFFNHNFSDFFYFFYFFFFSLFQCHARLLDFTLTDLNGREIDLAKYDPTTVFLFVNVASQCGFTNQNYQEVVPIRYNYYLFDF